MRKIVFCLMMISTVLFAEKINVAVAANVSYAMDALKAEFEKENPDIEVIVTLGSSGKLTAQIRNGAPYGIFMAANMNYPKALFTDKIALAEPVVYAQGSLAYFSVKPQDFSRGMALLLDPGIHKIAVANPKTAPYGKAAVEAISAAQILEQVKDKFVFAESISQAVAYSISAADIGFIATSSLYSPKMRHYSKGVHWFPVDPALYRPIEQGLVLLKSGDKMDAYKRFYLFLLSDKAKDIFKTYGYIIK